MAKTNRGATKPEGAPRAKTKSKELSEGDLDKVAGGGAAGINALIAVSQAKVNSANEDALDGAAAQKSPK